MTTHDVTPSPLRVASVPSGHAYARHLLLEGTADRVILLPDLLPHGAEPGRWWPPVMLDAGWVRANADSFDLLHLHFGMESFSTPHLEDVVDALADADRPLVYTVHDLENPQLTDQRTHVEQVGMLVSRADAVITLTDGAADAVEGRWGRRPVVIPHPNVLPLDARAPAGTRSEALVVGVHLRDLRPNIDAVGTVEALLGALDVLAAVGVDVVVRVHLNDRVRDPAARDRVVALVAADPRVTVLESPRLSDADLARSLADLDVAVLPYRHGTHSGWAELCFDLGVPVVGARVGHVAEQHPETYSAYDSGDARSLAAAIARATRTPSTRPGTAARRRIVAARRTLRQRDRRGIHSAHLALYREAVLRRRLAAAGRQRDGVRTGADVPA